MPSPRQTPSQTVGPFFGVGLTRPSQSQHVLVSDLTDGERIRIEGTVLDGVGQPDRGRARRDLAGQRARPVSPRRSTPAPRRSIRRSSASAAARPMPTASFGSTPSNPARFSRRRGRHAPHLNVTVFARGMLVHAFTRMYFADDPLEHDPALALVDSARAWHARRRTHGASGGRVVYRWDIHLQGERRPCSSTHDLRPRLGGVLRSVRRRRPHRGRVRRSPAHRQSAGGRSRAGPRRGGRGVIPAAAAGAIAPLPPRARDRRRRDSPRRRRDRACRPSSWSASCAARWAPTTPAFVHRGATSQDIVDTAAILGAAAGHGADRRTVEGGDRRLIAPRQSASAPSWPGGRTGSRRRRSRSA